jgi:hypothetical protein
MPNEQEVVYVIVQYLQFECELTKYVEGVEHILL